MNITNSTWYTGVNGCIGVVQIDSIEQEMGLRKNYIGVGGGVSEALDAVLIASTGVPFHTPTWIVDEIVQKAREQAVSAFYQEVCRRAEKKMAQTGRLEGAHYASMVEIMREMGLMSE